MPELQSFGYMVELLQEAGYIKPGANGAVPLTWSDLRDWCEMTCRRLSPSMAKLLITLSNAYSGQLNESSKNVPAPHGGEDYAIAMARVYGGFKADKAKGKNGR